MFLPPLLFALSSNGVISSGSSVTWSVWRVFRCLQVRGTQQVLISCTLNLVGVLNCFTAHDLSSGISVFLAQPPIGFSLTFLITHLPLNCIKNLSHLNRLLLGSSPSILSSLSTWSDTPSLPFPHASISLTAPAHPHRLTSTSPWELR